MQRRREIQGEPVEYLDPLVVVPLCRVQHGVGVDLRAGRAGVGLALVRELLGLLAVECTLVRKLQLTSENLIHEHDHNRGMFSSVG